MGEIGRIPEGIYTKTTPDEHVQREKISSDDRVLLERREMAENSIELGDAGFIGQRMLKSWRNIHKPDDLYKCIPKEQRREEYERKKKVFLDDLRQLATKNKNDLRDALYSYIFTKKLPVDFARKAGFSEEFLTNLQGRNPHVWYYMRGPGKEGKVSKVELTGFNSTPSQARSRVIATEFTRDLAQPSQQYVLTDKELISFIKHRKSELESKMKYVEAETERWKHDIREMIEQVNRDSVMHIPQERAFQKLDTLHVTVVESLSAALKDRGGSYDSGSHTARLSSGLPPEEMFFVMIHETVHGISGRSEVLVRDIQFDGQLNRMDDIRLGVSFTDTTETKKSEYIPNFNWLNEALTERAAIELAKKHEQASQVTSWAYPGERALLDLLVENGVPLSVFFDAYFEDYTMKDAGEHRTPALQTLFQKAHDVFGKRFLVDLDVYLRFEEDEVMRKARAQSVADEWKSLGTEKFIDMVRERADEIRQKLQPHETGM